MTACFAGLGAGADGAAAPALRLNPIYGTPGSLVEATGVGFCSSAACSTVTIRFASVVVASNLEVSSQGTFATSFRVPGGTLQGQQTVDAVQTLADGRDSQTISFFTVTLRPAVPPARLYATVGTGSTLALKTATGATARRVRPGVYLVVVHDRTRAGNFHLFGLGVNKRTGIRFTGSLAWTVVLSANRVYRYRSDSAPRATRSFRTTAGT